MHALMWKRFLWGESNDMRKVNLYTNLGYIFQPKMEGLLAVCSTRKINDAFLIKLA